MADKETEVIPISTGVETVLDLVSVVTSVVPYLGGPVSNVLNGFSTHRKLKRIREVLEGVASDLETFSLEVSQNYAKTAEFEDLLEQTLRRVADEGVEEKRRLYRTFLTDTVKAAGGDYQERRRFLRCLEEIETDHLHVLRVLMEKSAQFPSLDHYLSERHPMARERIQEIVSHLASLNITIEMPQTREIRLTSFGQRFIRFMLQS